MSISSSLSAGVAGLTANATRLATIADNIQNSSTSGYKRASVDFQSFVIDGSANSGSYTAGGVTATATRIIDERGPIESTGNALDIAVTGRGMLPVTTAAALGDTGGSEPLMMTTTGSFDTDEDGVLRTSSGLVLLGWPADSDGSIPTLPRDTTTGLEPVVVNVNQTAGDPTTTVNLGVNLPATATSDGATGDDLPLSIEYFGNLGTSETLEITFTPTLPALAGDPDTNTWTMSIADSAQGGTVIGSYELEFDDSRADGGTLSNVTDLSGGTTYDAATGELSLNVAGGPITVVVGRLGDQNGLTQLSDSFSPTSITSDGSPVGNLTSVEIDEGGYVTATYDTGFTRTIYQVPLVDVPNLNGLTSLNNQTYQVSQDSGSFFLWDAGDGPTASIAGYALEGSATDVASELTSLIQTQRAYSSNAKIIQTVDEMLQETTNIKR